MKKGKSCRYDCSEQSLTSGGFPYMISFIKDVENALLNNDVSLKEIMRSHLEQRSTNCFNWDNFINDDLSTRNALRDRT